MLTVVCFKWRRPGYRSTFGPEAVNALRRMVRRQYAAPHRFVCLTDDPAGLDPDVEARPIWTDFANVPSPHGGGNPSCYRRLRLFAPDVGAELGERILALDLDTVIVDDVRPLWDRPDDFVIWGETDPRSWYNGSMMLIRAGARPHVWTDFDPATSPARAKAAGKFGSDQGWISYRLGPGEATWSTKDGVFSYRVHLPKARGLARLPAGARIVMFHGKHDPWMPHVQRSSPWILEHWKAA